MNKQEIEEVVSDLRLAFDEFRLSDAVAAFGGVVGDLKLFFGLDDAFHSIDLVLQDVTDKIASPNYNRPANVPTALHWSTKEGYELATIEVSGNPYGGKWNFLVTPCGEGYEVFLEADSGFSTSFFGDGGFATQENARLAAYEANRAVAAVLTEHDGSDFICDTFRQALSYEQSNQRNPYDSYIQRY